MLFFSIVLPHIPIHADMFNLSQKTKGFNAVLYKKHVSFVIFHFLCYDRILDFRKEDILWQKELLGKTIGHFF